MRDHLRKLKVNVVPRGRGRGDDEVYYAANMPLASCAAYAALHWYRMNPSVSVDSGVLQDLVPQHPEFRHKHNRPYLNTLALLRAPQCSKMVVHMLATAGRAADANVVVAYETRALVFGALVAYELGVSFVPVRTMGSQPGLKLVDSNVSGSMASYREEEHMVMDGYSFVPSDRVMIVDDVVCTGSTTTALQRLVEAQGAEVVGCAAVVDLLCDIYLRHPNHTALVTLSHEDTGSVNGDSAMSLCAVSSVALATQPLAFSPSPSPSPSPSAADADADADAGSQEGQPLGSYPETELAAGCGFCRGVCSAKHVETALEAARAEASVAPVMGVEVPMTVQIHPAWL